MRILFAFWLLLAAALPAQAQRNLAVEKSALAERRVALVIGNGAYPSAPLKNPANDARDMAIALRKLGFEVIEKINAPQKEMNRAIAQFGDKLNANTVALFFYAGHGMQVRGKNYLLPIDAQISSESSVRAETVDVDAVLDQFAASPLNVVILDACRNNPFERRFRSTGGGLAQMDAPKGTLIAYATAPGKVASDGEGRNGLYTQELLKQLQTPELSVEAVFKRVRAGVARATGDAQIPWEASSLTGEFYFRPPRAAAVVEAAPETVVVHTPDQIEQQYWNRIRDSQEVIDFEDYLKQYPQGRFTAEARLMVRKLGGPPKVVTPPPESQAVAAPVANRSRLGVRIQDVTPELAKSFGVAEAKGALVVQVTADGPAARAGMSSGEIVLAFQGRPVMKSADLPPLVAANPPGTKVAIQSLRDGRTRDYSVLLDRMPEIKPDTGPDAKPQPEADKQLAEFFKKFSAGPGVAFSQLKAADQQQLRALGFELQANDRIVKIVRRGIATEITTAASFSNRFAGPDTPEELSLLVWREGAESFITGKPPSPATPQPPAAK